MRRLRIPTLLGFLAQYDPELEEFRGTEECYEVSALIAERWPELKQEAGFYIDREGRPRDHAWNISPDGTIIDMTADQFGGESHIQPSDPQYGQYVSYERDFPTAVRYAAEHAGLSLEDYAQRNGITL